MNGGLAPHPPHSDAGATGLPGVKRRNFLSKTLKISSLVPTVLILFFGLQKQHPTLVLSNLSPSTGVQLYTEEVEGFSEHHARASRTNAR